MTAEFTLSGQQRVIDEITAAGAGWYEVDGAWGTGKSVLLTMLGRRLSRSGVRVVTLRIAAEQGWSPGTNPHPLTEFRLCLNLAGEISAQLHGDRRFDRTIDTLGKRASARPNVNQSIHASGHARVRAGGAQNVRLAWTDHLAGLTDELRTATAAVLTPTRRRTPIALLVDDFHHMRSPGTARWLLDVTRRLDNAPVVITRQRTSGSGPLDPGFRRHTLDVLTQREVRDYLTHVFGTPPSERRLRLFTTATGRLPWAVALLANFLGAGDDEAELHLARLSARPDVSRRVVDLLEILLSYRDPLVRDALERLSISDGFDQGLAEHLLEPIATDAMPTAVLLNELREALLLEPIGPPVPIRVPSLVATVVAADVRRRDPTRFAALHGQVAAHYWTRITRVQPATPGEAFTYWSRYEGRSWPRLLSAWVHHIAHVPHADRDQARLLITRWYLEGFFWYEWLVPHWFCERLLDAAQRLRSPGEHLPWLDRLHVLHANWPRGWRHEADPATWQLTIDALIGIRQDVGPIEDGPPEHATDASESYALATHLLAHCLRFQSQQIERASDYYDQVRAWRVDSDDAWSHAYVDLHQAELWSRANDCRLARRRLPGLERAARANRDLEMLTFVFRVEADRRWIEGRRAEALAAHLMAVLQAFRFLVLPVRTLDEPIVLAAYNREVYVEAVARATERIEQLRDEGDDALADRVERGCVALWRPFWEHAGRKPNGLFVPIPRENELGSPDGPYLRDGRWLLEQRDRLARLTVGDDLVAAFLDGQYEGA